MTFFAKVTAPSQATFETVEKKHVPWNAGIKLTGLRDLTDDARARMSASTKGKTRPAEYCTKISATKKGEPVSAEHRARLSQACKTKRAVMTYYGPFESVMAVARASGRNEETVRAWIRKFPEHYYYIGE